MRDQMVQLYAHTPRDGSDEWQLLSDHLKKVASLAADFAAAFGAKEFARCMGFLHDLGKASKEFQDYLIRCHKSRLTGAKPPVIKPDHKLAGAVCAQSFGQYAGMLAFPILGHHGGMPDRSDTNQRIRDERELEHISPVLKLASELLPADLDYSQFPPYAFANGNACETFLRMLYSCLVDADSLDTESFWEPEKHAARTDGDSINELWEVFQADQIKLLEHSKKTPVNQIRREIYNACVESATLAQGVFKLTVPTGGGKTRSGMAFALRHAIEHDLRHVIVAIPYTSIIDQNAAEYRKILGAQNVLEHHSAVNIPDSDQYSEEQLRIELAAENWNAPIVVTTTVQLFESLFSNKRSKCRKLHNLAGSVIILDEVQTLPPILLQPILDVLKELVANYRVSLVLSTATQPALLGSSPYIKGFTQCPEIVPDPKRYFDQLKRVEYDIKHEPWSWDNVASEIMSRDQVLCVLNSRKDAVALFKLLNDPDAFHLSTLMCPAHRKDVLNEIKCRLSNDRPCRVISTQVVEAGVDLNFPCVMRAFGPLDRIVQAAGRCNREGKMDGFGEVIVFQPEGGRSPSGIYATAMAEARRILSQNDVDLDDPDVFNKYFTALWQNCNLDAREICELRKRLDYPEVAARFRMIDEDTVSVLTDYGRDTISSLIKNVKYRGCVSRDDWRKMQPFSVSIYRNDFDRHRREGQIGEIVPGLFEWRGIYNRNYGISDDLPDPADLIG